MILTVTACGPRPIGRAVVLWPDEAVPYSAGQSVELYAISDIQQRVTIGEDAQQYQLDTWRVATFEDGEAAARFTESFLPWATLYARSLRTALPVRQEADRTSARVYRLRDGEVVKIIDRLDEQSDEAGLVDYWYQVLTENGTSGWVFGYYLELVAATGRAIDESQDQDQADRLVRDVASVVWRPEYFDEVARTGRVDLTRFNARFGLFGDADASTFTLVTPTLERAFTYTGYFLSQPNSITFEGTPLTLTLDGERQLVAQFTLNARERVERFVRFEGDIDAILETERQRRTTILESILGRGDTLVSTAFGTIDVDPDGAFLWQDYQRLVPSILPTSFTGQGTLTFPYYPADELRSRYDGVLTVRIGASTERSFLYLLTEEGLRLVYVPEDSIQNLVALSEPLSPVVLFYRFVQE